MSNMRSCNYCGRKPGEHCFLESGCIKPLKYDLQGHTPEERANDELITERLFLLAAVCALIAPASYFVLRNLWWLIYGLYGAWVQ